MYEKPSAISLTMNLMLLGLVTHTMILKHTGYDYWSKLDKYSPLKHCGWPQPRSFASPTIFCLLKAVITGRGSSSLPVLLMLLKGLKGF